MFTHLYRQSISCILSAVLLGNTLYADGIVVDTTAAQKYQAMIESTANGIPLINIVTPNSSGLSHNKFSDFNINPSGIILNNATSAVSTQLGGWVQGNANLGTTPARVILNEVTGTNRSFLRGYGEVAGHSADVIIANPNGITVNGGGFINSPRATLTTGTAVLNGDTLSGFHVQRGDILVEGTGLNADNIDRVDLYTKTLQLNAALYAKKLDVVTGENHIAIDGTVTSDGVSGSGYSIDSSALGGIYANTIRLVGTDKGVGINLPQITYASDSLSLSADGYIILGSAVAENTLSVQSHSDSITFKERTGADHVTLIASHNLANEGDLVGMQVDVSAGDMTNSGTMYSDTMNLNISNSLSNTGILSAYSGLNATATDMINGNGALIESQNAILDMSHSVHNLGTINAGLLSLRTPTLLNEQNIIADIAQIETTALTNNALMKGAVTLSVDTQTLINNGGMIGGNQLSIHANTITNNEVLYSANAIDLSASNTLRNTADATIKSAGSINIHDTGTLRNESATIQADGNILIQSTAVENISNITPTIITNHVSRYVESMVGVIFNSNTLYAEKWLDTIDKTEYVPSYILAGGDMSINAAIYNRYSMIATNGDLYLSGSVNNEASIDAHDVVETQYYYDRQHQSCGWSGCHWHNDSYWGALNHTDTITDHVYSTIQASGNIYGNLISINNADVIEGSVPTNTSSQGIPASSHFNDISVGSQYTLPNGNYSQFVTVTNPSLPYLIESNPLYADYNTFISSDYIMSRLHLDTAANTKRLGDARYETDLVRDAVFRLTGERYLAGFGSDTTQYQALMDNALAVSSDLHLELGVSLSASQIAALNRDIVWMEDQVVSGQHVLVPVVYLASLKNQELTSGGKIIAGGDMALAVAQGLNNGGELRAGGTLLAQADTITNSGGAIRSNGDMLLHTEGDITNTSGKISGNNVALVSDNGNIVSQTALKTITLNQNGTTGTLGTVGESATIQSKRDMLLSASQDITLTGAETAAGGNVVLAGENVTLSALEQNSHYTNRTKNGSSEIESVKQHASTLAAGGDVSINAAQDVTLHSSSVAGTDVAINAGENVNVTAANDREFMDVQTHNKSTFSSSSKRDMTLKENVVSSSINGNNISITSGKDTTLQAANLKAAENIQVDAAGDINVLAKAYREAELHQESKSSLGGLVSSASLDSTDAVKLHEATVKTEAKNIIMNSGKDINVVASNVSAGDALGIKAAHNINILSDEEQNTEQHYSKKSGLSLGFSDGMLTVAEEKQTKDAKANITQKSSNLSGKTIAVEAGQDVTSIGSNIVASTIDVNAQRDINILSATESASHDHKESTAKAGIGVTLNMNEASLFAGVITKSDKLGEGQTQEVGSQLLGDNITVHSGNNTNVLASDIIANNDVLIQADKNINILSQDATAYKNQVHKELKAGIKVGVEQHVTDAAKQLADTVQSLPDSDNVVSTGSKVLKSVDLVTNTLSHSVSAGFDAVAEMSKSETSAQSTSAQSSTIAAGHDVTLDAGEEVTVAGSDVMAGNKVSMNAENIILKSSAQNASSSSSDKSGSLKVTLFGTREGQVDASYAQSKNRSNDTTQRDSYIIGNDVTLNTSGDTTLQGAHVSGDTVSANVGGNLNLISVQDTGSSKGDSESIFLSTAGSGSVGAGKSSSSKAWVEEQTGIIATKQVDITVGGNTDLQGAIIATKDANGNDANNVHLATGTLSTSDISDHDTSTSMNIGIGNISASQFQADSKGTTGATLEAGYANSDKEQINRATIGGGTIALDQESLPTTLNRDITKAQQITKDESENYDIYASQNSINSVLNPTQTAQNWKQAAKDLGLSVYKEITENLPNGDSGGLAGVVGKGLDAAGGIGLLPSKGNGGGYITQIATQLTGDNRNMIILKDKQQLLAMGIPETDIKEVIQTNKITGEEIHVYTTNPNKAVRIDEQPIDGDPLRDYKIHISSEAIKAANLDHLFTNGMFNPVDVAIYNQQTQQGGANSVLNYNQTHGIVGDFIEDVQDHLTSNTGLSVLGTGGSRQTGEVIDQMATITNGNLTVGAHSQGTMMTQNGMNLYKDDLKEILKNNPNSQLLVGYAGSPVNHNVAADLVTEIYGGTQGIETRFGKDQGKISNVFRSQVNPQDLVGSLLGWQSAGVNQSDNVLLNIGESLLRLPSLFIPSENNPSPHSYYPCIIGCGDESVTQDIKNFYNPKTDAGQTPLADYYKTLNVDLNLYTKDKQ